MRFLTSRISLFVVMFLALAGVSVGQDSSQSPKQDMKDAAHSTTHAAKKTGHEVKKGTKKATHKGAKMTRKTAKKVEDKTMPQ